MVQLLVSPRQRKCDFVLQKDLILTRASRIQRELLKRLRGDDYLKVVLSLNH